MKDLEKAVQLFQDGEHSMVAVKNDKQWVTNGRGIRPLYQLVTGKPAFADGASIADKVIGKAAALLAVYGGIKAIYAELTTTTAHQVCERYGITLKYKKKVEAIENRDRTGLCPMEQLAKGETDPAKMLEKVKQFFENR